MVKYTLCGATGATGRSILRCLLANPPQDLDLNIVLRNKKKLVDQFPDLETSTPFPTHIFESSNTDIQTWKQALSNTDVILMCIATNESKKGNTLFSDTASAVTSALQELQYENQQHESYTTPTILILRTSTLNKNFNPGFDSPALVFFALRYLYDAMIEANEIYEVQAREYPGLLQIVYVDPPAIHDEAGTVPTGYRLDVEPPEGYPGMGHNLSYADLGVAFCEVARRREEFRSKGKGSVGVAVTATGKVRTTWGANLSFLAGGVVGRCWG